MRTISVTPTNTSMFEFGTLQFRATGTYADGHTQDLTTSVTWSSSDPSVAAVSNNSGSQGLVTAPGFGTTTITATLMVHNKTVSGSTPLTVFFLEPCFPGPIFPCI